jgi:hypothetical protein
MDDGPVPPLPDVDAGGGGTASRDDVMMLAARVEELSEGMVRLTAAVRTLINQVELLSARVAALERAVPLRRPPVLPSKLPPKLPPRRPKGDER